MKDFGLFVRSKLTHAIVAGAVLLGAGSVLPGNFPGVQTAAAAADPMSGNAWQINVTPDSSAAASGRDPFTEYLMFDSLGYTTQELCRLGFTPNAYSVTPVTGGVKFSVTLTSGTAGTLVWNGTLNTSTNIVNGTVTWTKGSAVYTYSFNGAPYTPPAAP